MRFFDYVSKETKEEILKEWSLFKKKPEKEDIEIDEKDLKQTYYHAISAVKKYVSQFPLVKKHAKFNDITDYDEFKTFLVLTFFMIDAWDLTPKARDDDEYDQKVTPVYNQVYEFAKFLNEKYENDRILKYFVFDADGDWDDCSLDISPKSQYNIKIKG